MPFIDQGLVDIAFRLKDFKCYGDMEPVLTGSICELGEWDALRAIRAERIDDDDDLVNVDDKIKIKRKRRRRSRHSSCKESVSSWICIVSLPYCIEFDWSWALLPKNKNKLFKNFSDVENAVYRRDDVGYFEHVISSNWGLRSFSSRQIPVKSCEVTFILNHKKVGKNQTIGIIGSSTSLGCWIPRKTLLATKISPCKWQVKTQLALKAKHEWKWVKFNTKTNKINNWERIRNRILYTNFEEFTLHCDFNGDASLVVKAPEPEPESDDYCKFYDAEEDHLDLPLQKIPSEEGDWYSPYHFFSKHEKTLDDLLVCLFDRFRSLRVDLTVFFKFSKETAYVPEPVEDTMIYDITDVEDRYEDALSFKILDGFHDQIVFRYNSNYNRDMYDNPDRYHANLHGRSQLLKILSDVRRRSTTKFIEPMEEQIKYQNTAEDYPWIKRTYYYPEKNLKFQFVLRKLPYGLPDCPVDLKYYDSDDEDGEGDMKQQQLHTIMKALPPNPYEKQNRERKEELYPTIYLDSNVTSTAWPTDTCDSSSDSSVKDMPSPSDSDTKIDTTPGTKVDTGTSSLIADTESTIMSTAVARVTATCNISPDNSIEDIAVSSALNISDSFTETDTTSGAFIDISSLDAPSASSTFLKIDTESTILSIEDALPESAVSLTSRHAEQADTIVDVSTTDALLNETQHRIQSDRDTDVSALASTRSFTNLVQTDVDTGIEEDYYPCRQVPQLRRLWFDLVIQGLSSIL